MVAATFSQRTAKQQRHADAVDAERSYREALESRLRDLGSAGHLKPPPARERRAKRFGGGTVAARGGDYDWFYELAPAEQSRIRKNWFKLGGVAPDEVEHAGMAMGEWLALTRGIDAAGSVRSGRALSAKRYGGAHPLGFLARGDPADHGRKVDHFTDRAGRRHPVDGSDRVQYFTDKHGVVHPIRASYAPTRIRSKHTYSYDPDEVF